jgi:hypothetical protein
MCEVALRSESRDESIELPNDEVSDTTGDAKNYFSRLQNIFFVLLAK